VIFLEPRQSETTEGKLAVVNSKEYQYECTFQKEFSKDCWDHLGTSVLIWVWYVYG
jgi:hypothetical protein